MEVKETIIEEISALFTENGEEQYFGEKVSQYEHAVQAMQFAIDENQDTEMQIAGFLHDIGHMLQDIEAKEMDIYGRIDHEQAAANWLAERGFSSKIQTVIENHVAAKKYLCFRDSEYYGKLSDASKKTLEFQGGMMGEKEALAFEVSPYFKESIMLRRWDDQAKIPDSKPIELENALLIIRNYLNS
jgi:predicted HD phosphohydrolase